MPEGIVTCDHCGVVMKFVMGPRMGCKVNTYVAECSRMDLESRLGKQGTIYPQRIGNICYKHIPCAT